MRTRDNNNKNKNKNKNKKTDDEAFKNKQGTKLMTLDKRKG